VPLRDHSISGVIDCLPPHTSTKSSPILLGSNILPAGQVQKDINRTDT
jgi:hypothetical protein